MKKFKMTLYSAAMSIMFLVVLATGMIAANAAETAFTLRVDAAHPGINISPDLYGIFFEDINHAADGGLYAELIQNRSFEDNVKEPAHWTLVKTGNAAAAMALESENLLNSAQKKALRLDVTEAGLDAKAGVANDGYWGINVKEGTTYDLSFFAKASEGFTGSMIATLQSADGQKVYGQTIFQKVGTNWTKYAAKITATASDAKAKLVLSTNAVGSIWFDVVSLFPPTFKNRANGLRPDLAEMTKALKPSFLRFPGGCFVEGNYMEKAFEWKKTIGKIEERAGHPNIWAYRTTDGMGYHEFLQLCEDTGAAPLYVANIGIAHKDNIPLDKLDCWIQDALDAIEYANGDTSTKYGALRAANGHPQPFNLKYIEIGNENNQYDERANTSDLYGERYLLFSTAIRLKYPNIKLVGNVEAWGTDTPSWKYASAVDFIDEHYYKTTQWFLDQTTRYDSYDRNGPKVYVGEYAVTKGCGKGNLNAAIGEAAIMTGFERNSDIVKMASYAPLFVNANDRKWNPDLIVYNSSEAYGTPSYYVQKMFSNNVGNVILPTVLNKQGELVSLQTKGKISPLYYVTSLEQKSGDIIIKAVNATNDDESINIQLEGIKGILSGSASILTSGSIDDENSFENPAKVVPINSKLIIDKDSNTLNYNFPKNSVIVLRFKTAK